VRTRVIKVTLVVPDDFTLLDTNNAVRNTLVGLIHEELKGAYIQDVEGIIDEEGKAV
jgi:hypothetical protein